MFFLKGWIPLVDVFSSVHEDIERETPRPQTPVPSIPTPVVEGRLVDQHFEKALKEYSASVAYWLLQTEGEAETRTWDICDRVQTVAVMSPSGTHVLASKMLLEWFDLRSLDGRHVNLALGTVGSVRWLDHRGDTPTESELVSLYGPFIGLPVILKSSEVSAAKIAIAGEKGADSPSQGYSPAEVARRIIAAVDAGGALTKGQAKADFAGPMTHGQFLRAWQLATDQRPALKAPGRRRAG